jgi:L-rhamnose mutarotase
MIEYKRKARAVWPEMLDAITRAVLTLLFLQMGSSSAISDPRQPQMALRNLGSEEANTRWQEYMKGFFESASRGAGRADENMIELEEVFHLE